MDVGNTVSEGPVTVMKAMVFKRGICVDTSKAVITSVTCDF